MSDYIFLVNVGEGIENHVSLTNFSPNRQLKSCRKINFKVGIYIYKHNSLLWEKLDELKFKDNNITLKSADYNLDVGQLAVIIPCALDFLLLNTYSQLPRPIDRKTDESPVNDRGSIYFHNGRGFSSYQGEFPYQMSTIKGTFLAFDSLTRQGAAVKQKMVFINIHSKKILINKIFTLSVANSNSKETIATYTYTHNSACIIDIPKNTRSSELCFYSKDTLGIPIFIAYDKSEWISVEHTHAPSELFWNNQFKGQQLLKKNWLSKLS